MLLRLLMCKIKGEKDKYRGRHASIEIEPNVTHFEKAKPPESAAPAAKEAPRRAAGWLWAPSGEEGRLIREASLSGKALRLGVPARSLLSPG